MDMGLIHRIANFSGGKKWSSKKKIIKDRKKEVADENIENNSYEEIFEENEDINYIFSTTEYWLLNRHII